MAKTDRLNKYSRRPKRRQWDSTVLKNFLFLLLQPTTACDDGYSAPAGVAEGAPLLPAHARYGLAILRNPTPLRLLSGLCGSHCGADPAMRTADCSTHSSLLVRENKSFHCVRGLEGSAPFGHTVAAGAGGGTAGPAGLPGSLTAVCGHWAGPGNR